MDSAILRTESSIKKENQKFWLFLGVLTFASPSLASEGIDAGDTAWMLVSSAMVLFMVPGLALFYGGMARSKNVLGTMMHSLVALGVIMLQWIFYGFSLAFSEGNSFIGGLEMAMLRGIHPDQVNGTIPMMVFIAFQGTFACITPALISGAIAERVKFGPYVLFILLWSTFVYDPVCHWVWQSNGFLFKDGAIDFAGGTVVHIISGVAGLVACMLIGKRKNIGGATVPPHNLVLTVLGAGMLWFGWFGFNAGSALGANSSAGLAFLNTFVAPAAAMCSWMFVEKLHRKSSTALGAASGVVAGLVAITPAAGSVMPVSAAILGAVVGVICYFVVGLKGRFGYDDSLDAFGIHGVGGAVGALGCGVFASVGYNSLLFHGNPEAQSGVAQFLVQCKSVLLTAGYSAVVTAILVIGIKALFGFRVSSEDEEQGIDLMVHGERAYNS